MMTTTENVFSHEDFQLIEVHQLGSPLAIFHIKPGTIRLLRWVGRLIFLIGIFTLIMDLTQKLEFDLASPTFIGSLCELLVGGVFYSLMVQQARSTRAIVCEHGLLQVSKKIIKIQAEAVLWKDILSIAERSIGQECTITYLAKKPFTQLTLTRSYQNLDELVTLITERSKPYVLTKQELYNTLQEMRNSILDIEQPQEGGMYRCPCCKHKTLRERANYTICPVCYWTDDGQNNTDANTNRFLSPNHMSLALGRENYQRFGAIQRDALASVRPPLPEEL